MGEYRGKTPRALLCVALAFGLAGCGSTAATAPAASTAAEVEPIAVVTEEVTTPTPTATPTPTESVPGQELTTFEGVVDGDTIDTAAGRVRIIGIDTPELGECGYQDAAGIIRAVLLPGDPVILELPPGQNATDRHDRLIRYVITQHGEDIGTLMIEAGNAVARYDSRDGYPAHPREEEYHAKQLATRSEDGKVVTTTCAQQQAAAEPVTLVDASAGAAPAEAPWYTKYRSCSHLKKNTVGDPKGPFDVNNPDHADIYDYFTNHTGFNGDGDGDGLACE